MYMNKMEEAENVHEQIVVYVFVYFILFSYTVALKICLPSDLCENWYKGRFE